MGVAGSQMGLAEGLGLPGEVGKGRCQPLRSAHTSAFFTWPVTWQDRTWQLESRLCWWEGDGCE